MKRGQRIGFLCSMVIVAILSGCQSQKEQVTIKGDMNTAVSEELEQNYQTTKEYLSVEETEIESLLEGIEKDDFSIEEFTIDRLLAEAAEEEYLLIEEAQIDDLLVGEVAEDSLIVDRTILASPSVSGSLQVKGTQLCDCYGNPVQLRGISTHGIAWFPDYIKEESFSEFRYNWDVNVIRLVLYTADYNGYCTGGDREALKELIRKGVEYAAKQDLYVVLDWHILSDGNPMTYKEEAKAFFAEMAAECAGYHNVLYEICNEPNGQTSWADIKAYAEEVIPVIREKDSEGIIIVGTPNWSQYVDQAAADPITEYDNIMYTLHFYAATHTQSLRNTMIEAVSAGLPIFVTEFGICDASGNGTIDFMQANQWIETMDAYHISYIAWNLSNKQETSAILKSDCQKTYGFHETDLSDSGKWLYHMLTGKEDLLAISYPIDAIENTKTTDTEELTKEHLEELERKESVVSDEVEKKDEFSYKIVLYTSWEEDGKVFYQYGVTVKNISGRECSSWKIAILFNQTVSLQDGWNGNYSTEDTVLHITSKEYNGKILDGNEVTGIGFIVSGSAGLQAEVNR